MNANTLSPARFQQRVLRWFDRFGRHDLPWQHPRSAYRVWLSEIMLQQTQVRTVIPYFQRFVERFGDIHALAAASEDEVLHLWTGLGYYARARNLLKCAQVLVDQHNGEFPATVEALEQLPGIGRSTAGAIASIAFDTPAAILDGNVKRVLARFCAVEGWPGETAVHKALWTIAERYAPEQRCADYSQAMMDLGATLCTRSRPACDLCPLSDDCAARAAGSQANYPGRKPRKALPVRSTTMLLVRDPASRVLLTRRPSEGLWGGLWSFPEVESELAGHDYCIDRFGMAPTVTEGTPDGVMEGAGELWYNWGKPEAIGLAAPVARLIRMLEERG